MGALVGGAPQSGAALRRALVGPTGAALRSALVGPTGAALRRAPVDNKGPAGAALWRVLAGALSQTLMAP